MDSTPAIAVHIATYNNAATIADCLHALQQQTIPFELCIVDNASEDATVTCIQQMSYPVIINSRNLGYSAAHNQALRHTNAPVVLTLNPDVRLMPDFLEKVLAAFKQYPNAGALSGLLLRVDALDSDPFCVDSCGLYMQSNHRQRLRYEGCSPAQAPQTPSLIFGPDGAAAVYRRALLDDIAIGGEVFDEDFFIQKEDIDMCWRMQFQGWDALYIPAARAHHIRGFRPGKRRSVGAVARYYGVRNRYLLLLKHARWPLLLRHFIPLVLYDMAILLYLLVFEQRSLVAFVDALRLARKMLHKRRSVQQRQLVPDTALLRWFGAGESCL